MSMRKSARKRVAENVCRNRRRKRLSQQRLADRIGISRVNLCRLENGRQFPSPENLDRLALILEVDVSSLFRETH